MRTAIASSRSSIDGIEVSAAYVPGHDKTGRQERFWQFLVDEWSKFVERGPAVLI